MPDNFYSFSPTLTSPYEYAFDITPNDDDELSSTTRGIFCGYGGNVNVIMTGHSNSEPITFVNVPDGAILKIRATKVASTGTDAGNLIGLY